MSFTNNSSQTTLLPPKQGQSTREQSSGKFENSMNTHIAFQAPKSQNNEDRVRTQQVFPHGESITTFLPPTIKEHKKPRLSQSDLILGNVISFLPPKMKSHPLPVIKTILAQYSAINFRVHNNSLRTGEIDTQPLNSISIQPNEENQNANAPAILPKEEVNLNSSDPTTFLEINQKDTPYLPEETQLVKAKTESPLKIINESPKTETQTQKEIVKKVQPQIIEETNLNKGLGSIIFIGVGIGGLVLLAFAWFLFRGEPQSLSNVSDEPQKEKNLQPSKSTGEDQPIPPPTAIAYAQVVTNKGSSLIIRAEKSKESAQIGNIPYQAKVEILEYASYYSVLDGENGKWVYVKYQDKMGWCWGNYLKEIQE